LKEEKKGPPCSTLTERANKGAERVWIALESERSKGVGKVDQKKVAKNAKKRDRNVGKKRKKSRQESWPGEL